MTPADPTPLSSAAALLEETAEYFDLRNGHSDQAREAFDAAARQLRAVEEVLPSVAELLRQFEQHSDPRFKLLSDRLRTVLSREGSRDG